MDAIRGWLVSSPETRAFDGIAAAGRPYSCYLLERGVVVQNPRCAACGKEFRPPRRCGERFRVALEVFEPPLPDRISPTTTRLFVGRRVLVARVAAALQPLIEKSISYVGPRVMVAVLAGAGSRSVPALFCGQCADAIATHVNSSNQRYYAWDWLADFEPRRLLRRLYRRVRPLPRELPLFNGLPAQERRRALAGPR
jgi:hypothetical protein